MRQALEQALVESPDDLAAHHAHADYLQEQGDTWGEFIAVQLALEDESLPRQQRDSLRAREQKLLAAHWRDWLGDLAPYLLDERRVGRVYEHRFARGWLDNVRVPRLGERFAQALAFAPQARLLRTLLIDTVDVHEELPLAEEDLPVRGDDRALYRLAQSPHLGNLTVLRLGEPVDVDHNEALCVHCRCPGYLHLVRRLPRLQELYLLFRADDLAELFALPTLTNLRVLQVYHSHRYPLRVLADNAAFANLTTLLCHPAAYSGRARCLALEDFRAVCRSPHLRSLTHLRVRLTEVGDEGCREVVESGLLKRLKVLDLNLGSVTDEGARLLAGCPDLRRLDFLDLGRNALTEEGIAALQATGVRLRADDQHEADDEESEWFSVGDIE
jgi:uncharacterized protein (TIGR02996 family)